MRVKGSGRSEGWGMKGRGEGEGRRGRRGAREKACVCE